MFQHIVRETLPEDLVFADIQPITARIIHLLCTSNTGQGEHQPPPNKSQNWSIENVFASNVSDLLISKTLVNHTALAVSDGSFKLQRGTSAAIIEDRGNQQRQPTL